MTRRLWLLFWTLSVIASASQQQQCPANTFTCKDGSCIPVDWVGDGEPDCDDGSDEQSKTVQQQNKEDDPFDEVVTLAPHGKQVPAKTGSASAENTTEECPYEHQLRIDECSEPVLLFIHEVNAIYFENSSFLADKEMQSKIEKGCDLMNEYNICVQGASQACKPDEGVLAWHEVEMYICQLLIPAVREHQQCFSRGRDSQCKMRFDPLASPFCRLVTSVSQDVECVQNFSKDCSEAAMEMLPPVLEESHHIAEAIRCRVVSSQDMTTMSSVDMTTEDEEEETTITAETTVVTQKMTTEMVVDEEEATMAEEDTTTTSAVPTTTVTVDEETTVGRELKLNMSDAVNALYYIYDVCSADYSKSPFKSVVAKLCTKQDDIAKYSDCYQATLEKMKCATRDATTECEALDAFNSNLDCAIVTMNDACEVAAQNFVIDLQEGINDVLIEKKCFSEKKEDEKKKEENLNDGEFHLKTSLPKCSDEQENGALACLVELVEINKQLAQFQNLNFLLEIATPNSTAVEKICELYGRYEKCLETSVFKEGGRCSFASPLNSLARIGLAPICSLDSRPLLSQHRDCLLRLAKESNQETNCQGGLSSIGNTVNMMLQGIHGEALLCKSFYLIRETFACGERAVGKTCDVKALEDLGKLKNKMTALGEEEGCPSEQPSNLDEIIARPVKKPSPLPLPSHAPTARPIHSNLATLPPPPGRVPLPSGTAPVPVRPVPVVSSSCSPEQHKKFEACVQPLTAFQPHPLSVIKTPRQIDEACTEFEKFKSCVEPIGCHPLWAKGMRAMFEYACGEGAEGYKEVKQCIRKTAGEDVVRECVAQFSRGAPTQACLSANKLLACAMGSIQTECGNEGSEWVLSYVTKFATAIDPRCKLASQLPIGKVVGVGCTAEEEAIIEHCAAPLNDIGARMEELFQGGLQSMIKNVNNLAPVFAGGCNLTDEFRTCAAFLLSGRTPCVVSSCMIQAGDGVCNQPDPAKAIDDNLSCVFSQVQEPTFAKCVRTTLSTVKQFTLSSFRNILPKFIDCTEELVKAKCGETPIKVLRAMSSPDLCPVGPASIVPLNAPRQPVRVEPVMPVCTEEKRKAYEQCTRPFFSRYRMLPISLLNDVDNMDQVCQDVSVMDGCSLSTRICSSPEETALKKMVDNICATREAFEKHKICLKTVATGSDGSACMSEFVSSSPSDRCISLTNAAKCMASEVLNKCGEGALAYSYQVMADYAKMINPECAISLPSVALATGCTEDDMIQFLSCEGTLDSFNFSPISIVGNHSQLDSFCTVFANEYRPCISRMKCHFEPASSANIKLMEEICERPVTRKEQNKYGKCLSEYTANASGKKCVQKMAEVDPLSKEAPALMCSTLDSILSCAAVEIEEKCGYDALLHVFDTHIQWATSYNASCIITSPEPKSLSENELSRDQRPDTVVLDETTPPTTMSTTPSTQPTTTMHPKALTTPAYKTASTVCVAVVAWVAVLRVL